jgi:hypothetical protein
LFDDDHDKVHSMIMLNWNRKLLFKKFNYNIWIWTHDYETKYKIKINNEKK